MYLITQLIEISIFCWGNELITLRNVTDSLSTPIGHDIGIIINRNRFPIKITIAINKQVESTGCNIAAAIL